MKGLNESPLPEYLIGFPAGVQGTVRNLVEDAKEKYKQECVDYSKKGESHPVREEVYGRFIESSLNILRRGILEHKVENFSAPNLFLAAVCISQYKD